MEEWKEYKLEDIGNVVGGATPSTKDATNYDGDITWITPKDLSNHNDRYIYRGERMITQKGFESCSCKMLPKGSVLFSSRAPIGYVAIAGTDMCTNQGFKSVVPNNEIVDTHFLYYLLLFNKAKIEGMGSGTTFKEVSGNVMKSVTVSIPNLTEQKRIASILSSLDDKIELNRRKNDNLEKQAQALFNHYFIENIESLGAFEEVSLLDIATYTNGLAMQKYRPSEDETSFLPVLKIKELGQGFTDSNSDICTYNIPNIYIINSGDIIFSWSGTLMVRIWCGEMVGLNQHLFKVSSDSYEKWFYYFWTKYHLRKFINIANDKAVTMGHIRREDLAKSKVILPNQTTLQNLNKIFSPILDSIINNEIESKRLSQLRDTLLPRLMSGELKINDLNC